MVEYTQKPQYDTMVFQKIYDSNGNILDDADILFLLNKMHNEIIQLKKEIKKLEEDK